METWPSTNILPAPSIDFDGFYDVSAGRLEMESATTRQRKLFSVPRIQFSVAWSFTQDQLSIFVAFLELKLGNGCDAFFFPVNLGRGLEKQKVKIVNGKYVQSLDELGYWTVTAVMEIIYEPSFCTSNITHFITIPMGDVDLSAYFGGLVVTSPGVADHWRLVTDDCGYDVTYFTGDIAADGTMIPGTSVAIGASGWNSATLSFHSTFAYPEGVYLQVNCGSIWSSRPCLIGGNS